MLHIYFGKKSCGIFLNRYFDFWKLRQNLRKEFLEIYCIFYFWMTIKLLHLPQYAEYEIKITFLENRNLPKAR